MVGWNPASTTTTVGLNVKTATSILIDFHRLHLQHAIAALWVLSSGNHENHLVFGTLLPGLFATDLVITGKVLGLLGLGLGQAWLQGSVLFGMCLRHYHIDLMFIIFFSLRLWCCWYVYACFFIFFVMWTSAYCERSEHSFLRAEAAKLSRTNKAKFYLHSEFYLHSAQRKSSIVVSLLPWSILAYCS